MNGLEEEQQEKTFEFDPSRFFESFVSVGKELIMKPQVFFQNLPSDANLNNPFIFLVVCAFLSSLFIANIRQGNFTLFFVLLFANTISGFVGSIVLHVFVSKIFGSKAPFQLTFRIVAYASIMDIVSWIPVIGPIAYFYGLYLIFLGLQEVHQLKPKQAGTALLSIILIVTVLFLFLLLMAPESINEGMKMMNSEEMQF